MARLKYWLWLTTRKGVDSAAALTVLGFTPGEAAAAVGRLDSALPVETLVREALKTLGKR